MANIGWPAVAAETAVSQAVAACARPGALDRQVVRALASASRAGSMAQVIPSRPARLWLGAPLAALLCTDRPAIASACRAVAAAAPPRWPTATRLASLPPGRLLAARAAACAAGALAHV